MRALGPYPRERPPATIGGVTGTQSAGRAQRVVVGVDGSAGARAAVAWCAEHAAALGAEVVAVHAIDPVIALVPARGPTAVVDRTAVDREHLEAVVDTEWCAGLDEAGVAHRARIVDGAAAAVLEEVADEEGASVIVVGRRGEPGALAALVGSVPRRLAQHARRPVLIVPTG